ncbi:MAG: TetR/AcrR family transcriptional regulator [Thermoleophilaceae bacterium]
MSTADDDQTQTTTRSERNRRSAAETREHVLEVAHELFYWHGIRATAVDKLAAEAGVGPTTLYRLFASKDDLVAAYVERAGHHYREWLTAATAPAVGSPRERILALFDALDEQVQPEHCRGCPFLMTLAEFPDHEAAAHQSAVAVKAWVQQRLRQLTHELGAGIPLDDTEKLADQLALVVEGAYASVQALGITGPAREARGIAEALMTAAGR